VHPESDSGSTSHVAHQDGGTSGTDLAQTLLARVDDIEGQLRAIPIAADEKALKEFRRTLEALSKRDPKFEERVTNRVDVVADRVETVARTVSTTAAGLAARDGDISQLRRELEAASGRVDTAVADIRRSLDPAALPEIRRALAALSEQKLPRGIEGRIEDLTAKLGMLSQRIDTVSSTVSTTAAGLAGRDGDVTALRRVYEAETARIDADLADLRSAIDPTPVVDLRQAVKQLSDAAFGQKRSNQRQLDDVGAKIDALVGRLDSFATSVTSTATRVSGSEEEISALRAYAEDGRTRVNSFVLELRQAVAALSAQSTALEEAEGEAARVLDARVSGVSGSVDDLAARLDSVTATVATTGKRLGDQDVELVAMERRFQEASSRVDGIVGDLTQALEELPNSDSLEQALQSRLDELAGRVAELSGHLASVEATLSAQVRDSASGSAELERLVVEERGKVDDLAGQLDSLATSAAATATRISGSEEEISALRAYLEDGNRRLSALVAESKQTFARVLDERVSGVSGSVDNLAVRLDSIAASESSTAARVSASEEQVSTLRGHVENSGVHLNSLSAAVAAATERVDARDVELEMLERRFHDASTRVDGLVAELSRALAEFPDPDSTRQLLEARLTDADRTRVDDRVRIEELADRLEAVAASVESMAGRAPETDALERRIAELVERTDTAAHERGETSSEVARLAAIHEVERAGVRSRLESLAASQESAIGAVSADELERRVAGFESRVEAIESERDALAARIGQLTSAFDTERASFQTQLEALATALSWTSPKSTADERLDELDKRMEGVERQSEAVASKVSQATTLLPTALRSLEARLDELAPGTRSTTATEYVAPLQPPLRGLEPSPVLADDEPDEDETPQRLPTPVVPIRGTDP
jgi:colicin import membrane protein